MRATLSILGLYNYDNTVLDGLDVPEGLDRETLIDYIFMECADLELLYPQLPMMKRLIQAWADARAHSWERLYQSTIQKYNMIHNYDRYEDWTDNGSSTRNGSSSGLQSATDTNNTTSDSNGTTTTSKAAYNTGEGLVVTDSVQSRATASANTGASSESNSQESHTETTADHQVRVGHLYGNIGVTTASQMLSAERELYKWDVYQAIAQEFKQRFCIMVY